MTRLPDWQVRIADVFIERIAAPFSWGSNDCCLFAADCFLAATGADPAEGIRGTYDSAISAARTMGALGGLGALAERWCGEPIEHQQAAFGDVGLLLNAGRPCLAIFGGQYFHAPSEEGLAIFPVEQCTQAWRLT